MTYRFPFCSGFIRPTDRLQNTDQKLASTGEHLPICMIDKLKTDKAKSATLSYEAIRGVSLSHSTFEDLFNTEKIGSRELTQGELTKHYEDFKLNNDPTRAILHAQEFFADDAIKKNPLFEQ